MNTVHQKLFLLCALGFLPMAHLNAGICGDFFGFLADAIIIAEQEHARAEAVAKKELERLQQQREEERRLLERRRQSSVTLVDPKEKIKSQLFDSLEKKLKNITNLDEQSDADKLALWKANQIIVENTMKQGFSSFRSAEKYAHESLPGGILEVVRAKAIQATKKKQWNNEFLKEIDETVIREVTKTLADGRSIGSLLKHLENNIESSRTHYFNCPQPRPTPRPAEPIFSAPPLHELPPENPEHLYPDITQTQAELDQMEAELDQNSIQEIFPQNDRSKDFGQFAPKTVHKKIFHASACSVCQEEFAELKKRVTLRCGHQICPQCLHNWIFTKKRQNQAPTCPECRHPILDTDFSADYISSKL